MDMRKLINLVEDPALKKQIIDVVKSTDDPQVLGKVLKVLKAGNIEERIKSVLGSDADASQFLGKIARNIIEIDAPIEEKDAFLEKIKKGIAINTNLLLDGSLHNFTEIVGTGFGLDLFKQLSVELVSQGVGPGEVALAVLSPNIAWSGRVKGGGDIIVNKKAVEVKTRASKGGRWINARKANMDLPSIARAISDATGGSKGDYIGLDNWVNTLRPMIKDQTLLANTAKAIADGTFSHVPNQDYQQALISGDENAIKFAIVKVGYDNYKKYSGFAGMLLMDLPTDQVQYFVDFDSMVGNISVGTPYIFSPEATMMPQVVLEPGATIRAGRFSVKPEQELAGNTNKELETVAINFAEKLCAERGVKDATKINVIATEIMADLENKIPPNKIYTNLLKKFPELAPRKKAPTAVTAPETEPETPAPAPAPAPGIGRQTRQPIQPGQTVEPIRPRRPG
jgi:hypothetical protein